jgi:hypothetical protein
VCNRERQAGASRDTVPTPQVRDEPSPDCRRLRPPRSRPVAGRSMFTTTRRTRYPDYPMTFLAQPFETAS